MIKSPVDATGVVAKHSQSMDKRDRLQPPKSSTIPIVMFSEDFDFESRRRVQVASKVAQRTSLGAKTPHWKNVLPIQSSMA